jgi:hypothetical protein
MKKILLILPLFIALSCGEEKTETTTKNKSVETAKTIDLTSYELPFLIKTEQIKDENGVSLNIEVLHEEGDLDWIVKFGERFNLVIEDWGDEEKNASIEIKRQQELEQFFVYGFIENENDYILYSKAIPGDSLSTEYNFYSVKNVGGIYYTIKSNPAQHFTLEEVKKMLEASKSMIVSDNTILQNA